MAIDTGLEGKPWFYSAAVGALIAAALIFGVNHFYLKKMKVQIGRQGKKLGELQQKINEGRAAEKNLPQFREEVLRLELELQRLLKVLPRDMNTDDLLRRFRALVQQGDLNLRRLTPSTPRPVDFYGEWPLRFQLQGTYHNLALFFDRLSRFARIINVDNLQVRSLKRGNVHTISTSFTAKTYLYIDSEQDDEEDL
jgi:Tfp pilus assembly protein PilO